MPPLMSESIMEMIAGGQTQRKTNFSIDAIMSAPKIKEEQDVCEDDIDVGKEEIDNDLIDNELVEKVKKEPKVSSRISSKSNSATLNELKCTLENKDLWDKFSEFGTEMIITRTGRRMFPTVRVAFNNIEKMVVAAGPGLNSAAARFHVLLDIVPADNKRYRYAYHRSQWLVAGKADPAPQHRLYPHPDGPFSLDQLRKQVTSFEKVKITNNESDNAGYLLLNSMHKFQPRVYLVLRRDGNCGPVTDIEKEEYRTFVFPETQFTAVTAYQNQCITKLKIESNPFAKGFRDTNSDMDDGPYSMTPHYMPGMPPMPGGMPGMDPFARLGQRLQAESNNNLMMAAAEKARMMMMTGYPGPAPSVPRPPALISPPSLPTSLPLSLPSELLARYSAVQASLGLYNPALLAAALRSSGSGSPPSLNSSLSSPRSPDLGSPGRAPGPRFSPYIVPRAGERLSPKVEEAEEAPAHSPSPCSSPPGPAPGQLPPRPAFPIFR